MTKEELLGGEQTPTGLIKGLWSKIVSNSVSPVNPISISTGILNKNKETLAPIAKGMQDTKTGFDKDKFNSVVNDAKSKGLSSQGVSDLVKKLEDKNPGFFKKEPTLAQDITKTVGGGLEKMVTSASDLSSGKISPLENAATQVAQPVGIVTGAVGNVAEHTPIVGDILKAFGKTIQKIPGVQQGAEAYGKLEESSPRLTNQIENVGIVTSLLPIPATGLVGKTASSAFKKTGFAKEGAKIADDFTQKASQTASDIKSDISEKGFKTAVKDKAKDVKQRYTDWSEDVNLRSAKLTPEETAIKILQPTGKDFDTNTFGGETFEPQVRAIKTLSEKYGDRQTFKSLTENAQKEKDNIGKSIDTEISKISDNQIPVKDELFSSALEQVNKAVGEAKSTEFQSIKSRAMELANKNRTIGLTTKEQWEVNLLFKEMKRLFIDGKERSDIISSQDALSLSRDLMGKVAERVPVQNAHIFKLMNEYGGMSDTVRLLKKQSDRFASEFGHMSPETFSKKLARLVSQIPILKSLNTSALQQLAREQAMGMQTIQAQDMLPAFMRLMKKQNIPEQDIKRYTDLFKAEFELVPQLPAGKGVGLSGEDVNLTPRTGYSKGVPLDNSELETAKKKGLIQVPVKKEKSYKYKEEQKKLPSREVKALPAPRLPAGAAYPSEGLVPESYRPLKTKGLAKK